MLQRRLHSEIGGGRGLAGTNSRQPRDTFCTVIGDTLHGLRLSYGLAHKPHQWPAPESLRGIRRAFLSLRLTSLSALGSMPLA